MKDFIKVGWEAKPLGDVCKFTGGGTPSKQNTSFWGGDIPWVSPKDMKSDVVSDSIDYITDIAVEKSAAKRIPEGAILIVVRSGILARTIPIAIAGRELTVNQDLKAIIPDKRLDCRFLAYYFQAVEPLLLDRVTRGATVHKLDMPVIKSLSIPIPPLEEQRKIVAVLDEAFEGLARAKENAEANLQSARELFENSVEAELEAVGQSKETSLGEHIDLLAGFAFKSKGYTEDRDAMRLMRGDNIVPGAVRWEGAKYWPLDDCEAYEKFQLAADDVLIAMDRTWIKAGIKFAVLSDDDVPSLLVQRVARIRCLASLDKNFLALLIGSKSFERYVLSIQTGTGVPHISPTQIRDFSFSLPCIEAQAKTVERLSIVKEGFDELSEAYSNKLQGLEDLRQSLLQKAFAGELT